ncbi:Stage 0 sporulation protein YaaT [Candidatus Magnetomoraceae bacterium gMMP-15]
MIKVVGIKFKPEGRVYDFDCADLDLKHGDQVVVDTEQGPGFGKVVTIPQPLTEEPDRPLKQVQRLADESDLLQKQKVELFEKEAYDFCMECIEELNLRMNLFYVEGSFDISRLTFYFTADGRVDFRDLVKMLINNLRVKIEMRQVGARNQAKMWGGIGRCGREICCSCFLTKFDPISIRMAKEQNLSLNPTKISGLCGRLMCCLTYEYETYKELKKKFPRCGRIIQTTKGPARVIRHNIIRDRITVRPQTGNDMEISLDDVIKENS